jgi:hypothetical protein
MFPRILGLPQSLLISLLYTKPSLPFGGSEGRAGEGISIGYRRQKAIRVSTTKQAMSVQAAAPVNSIEWWMVISMVSIDPSFLPLERLKKQNGLAIQPFFGSPY